MRTMNNIEYAFIVNELKQLIGKHFENAYCPSATKIRIKISGIDVVCDPGKRLNIAKYVEENVLSQFAKTLRKELENAKLHDVYQYNNDRVIVFDFLKNKTSFKIIFEMFADGNIVLTRNDETGEKTIAALKYEQWSDRTIKRDEDYRFPKSNIKNNVNDAIASAGEKYIIVALLQLPLGKEYIIEILKRCNTEEKRKALSLSANEILKLEKEIGIIQNNAKAFGFYENGKIIDFGVIKFSKYIKPELETREFQTLSEAVDEYYLTNKEQKNENIEKLKRRLEEQEKRLVELKLQGKEKREIADYIYKNYENIEKILNEKTKKKEIEVEV